ncbi:hypothetical protein ACH4JZ_18270 [Streptomyces sp. NPDC017615]|uniref:hypothetical protein n=1 Tax=Streptomyces sp. NPDC017615 TaxID=3365003 RepID=UPI0037A52B9D
MTSPQTEAPPGPGFVSGIRLATGVHRNYAFPVAQLLAYHAPPRLAHETVERTRQGMAEFAAALRLGPPDGAPLSIGHRIRMRNGRPWLDYGDDDYRLAIPASRAWSQVVEAGGPVRVLVLFDPLTAGATQVEIGAHVQACYDRGAMRWGTTYHV